DDRGPLVGPEAPEATLELVAIGGRPGRIPTRRVDDREVDLGLDPSARPALIVARVDEQSMHPRIEPIHIAQAWQLSPGLHEGLLHRILGEVNVAKDQSGDAEQP